MKNWKTTLTLALLAFSFVGAELAYAYHRPAPPRRPGYSDGFFDGLIVSTMAVLLSHSISYHHYKQMVMMGADEEAAAFLAGNAEPGALLQAAMNLEREVLNAAGVDAALSDEDVAVLIMKRAAAL